MAVTNQQIFDFLLANPNMSDAQIAATMQEFSVTPAQMAQAVGVPVEAIQERYVAAAPNTETAENINKLASQILSQGTTDVWTGGLPPEKAALYMASDLAKSGVTNIDQITKSDSGIVNSMTGDKLVSGYGERTGGNLWSGSYEGKGNTGFGVDFDAQGKPLFFTTGASSSDVGKIMPIIQLALAATGAGGLLGNALLGAGANTVASSALGNAIIGGVTTGIAGGDPLKGALLGGAGGALSGYLQGGPIDASGMTSTQFNDALETQLIGELQRNGLTNAQISQWLENASTADITSVVNALPVTGASDNLIIEAAKTPITANALTNVLSQTPTIVTTATRPEQVSPDTLNAVTSLLNNNLVTTPTVNVTATRPNNTDIPVITPITTAPITTTPITTTTTPTTPTVEITATRPLTPDIPVITPITTTPVVTPTITTPTTTTPTKDTTLTTADIIKLISVVPALVAIDKATTPTTPTGFDVVPIPESFINPPATKVAPFTPLTPIDFGNRNLLMGTQWEKFLDPNYGQVPEPIQYSQPSSLSYNDLMGILGSKQGYPAKSSLSINDIISGIQNQYGQAPVSTMG